MLTLHPVPSLSRKPAAYQSSLVKCMYVLCVTLSRKLWIPHRRTSPAGAGCNWPEDIAVLRASRSHSIDTKQRTTNSFHTRSSKLVSGSTRWELMAGLRRCIAEAPGPKAVPAGILPRSPRENGFSKWKGDLLSICKDQVLYSTLFLSLKLKIFGWVLLNRTLFCFQTYLVFEGKVVSTTTVQCF